ncbi:transposase [Bradyrhizobium sp. RT5a]|uniref:transposase n=1 Tax=unclassified Bradyrhizobium TaxID=2631580 RepID=UPI003398A3A5
MIAVLHTWDDLARPSACPRVVAGGGPCPDGTRWAACPPGFFLPVRVLSRLFAACFCKNCKQGWSWRDPMRSLRPRLHLIW